MVAAEVITMDETSNFTATFERALPVMRGTAGFNASVFFEVALGLGGEGVNMTQMSLSNGSKIRVPYPPYRPPDRSRLYKDMEIVDYYTSPLIVALGVLSNFLAYIVFTRSRLRKVASVPYLAAMAVTDSGALITDFIQKGLLKHHIYIISMVRF
ncbi:rhodopsin, GQ-coupled [Elysia marginata]|uniref:Rhodopsin, GQ-coupled n=1 Tax=Elysia marginata TaxID=1093978 RepID=A0AAV4EHK4_9GAST|nr:rhodopsin, GQ-coupled [Elysia marginata]